ncbi:hypothetical protein ACWD9K_37485 [Streptomyces sp. 900116325]
MPNTGALWWDVFRRELKKFPEPINPEEYVATTSCGIRRRTKASRRQRLTVRFAKVMASEIRDSGRWLLGVALRAPELRVRRALDERRSLHHFRGSRR